MKPWGLISMLFDLASFSFLDVDLQDYQHDSYGI